MDGFIFWTKNLTPFMDTLDEVYQRGYPFVVQYTINGYPRALEARVVDTERSVRSFRFAAEKYGEQALVWRYDTIIFTTNTDADFHRKNFATLASRLSGSTSEVVVSFMQLYKKTRLNLEEAARTNEFDWYDPPTEEKRGLLGDLVEIAAKHDISLSICTQPDLMVPGANEARCVDAQRLMSVAGLPIRSRLKGMRPSCGCYESKDIGDYNTCPHGCVYCYAVQDRSLALRRYQHHDPPRRVFIPPETSFTIRQGVIGHPRAGTVVTILFSGAWRGVGSPPSPIPRLKAGAGIKLTPCPLTRRSDDDHH